jgi:WD40 repeat protein
MMNPGDGAIPCLQFYTPPGAQNPSHLFSGSDDGSIAIWKAGGGWEHLKLMRGHKGPVRSLSVHPSGRLALSVGHDRGLRMWNLAKGRCSYTARLEAEADLVAFNPSGEVSNALVMFSDALGCNDSVARQMLRLSPVHMHST